MRIEHIIAEALERVDHNKYLLAKAIGKRAEELNAGAAPLIDIDIKEHQSTNIALFEIAEGKLIVSLEQ